MPNTKEISTYSPKKSPYRCEMRQGALWMAFRTGEKALGNSIYDCRGHAVTDHNAHVPLVHQPTTLRTTPHAKAMKA